MSHVRYSVRDSSEKPSKPEASTKQVKRTSGWLLVAGCCLLLAGVDSSYSCCCARFIFRLLACGNHKIAVGGPLYLEVSWVAGALPLLRESVLFRLDSIRKRQCA
jgi:hypothetical protein